MGVYWPQSDRVTESQTPRGTQYTGGRNFFVPDLEKLPYSLRSQGNDLRWVKWKVMFFKLYIQNIIILNQKLAENKVGKALFYGPRVNDQSNLTLFSKFVQRWQPEIFVRQGSCQHRGSRCSPAQPVASSFLTTASPFLTSAST